MTKKTLFRPHFRRPPIFEQAISVGFERIRELSIVDPGLFWSQIREEFPYVETGPRLPIITEWFDGIDQQPEFTLTAASQLPKTVYKAAKGGELVQLQDDKFVFNWVRDSEGAAYPRFERTSERAWQFFEAWAHFVASRYGQAPQLKQCELTNVNVIPVEDFGKDFADMGEAFRIDPFEWDVPGLVAETYVRQRVHRMVNEGGEPIGRLHSIISPVFAADGTKAFQFELTARSASTIRAVDEARKFFDHAHMMINSAFLASVTDRMRDFWGEQKHGE